MQTDPHTTTSVSSEAGEVERWQQLATRIQPEDLQEVWNGVAQRSVSAEAVANTLTQDPQLVRVNM